MRAISLIFPALTAVALLMPAAAHADPYKWCAQYGGRDGGARNCGFLTLEQCRATISGAGGFCEPNQFYTGPSEEQRPVRKRHRENN